MACAKFKLKLEPVTRNDADIWHPLCIPRSFPQTRKFQLCFFSIKKQKEMMLRVVPPKMLKKACCDENCKNIQIMAKLKENKANVALTLLKYHRHFQLWLIPIYLLLKKKTILNVTYLQLMKPRM